MTKDVQQRRGSLEAQAKQTVVSKESTFMLGADDAGDADSNNGAAADDEEMEETIYDTRRAFLGLVKNSYATFLNDGVIPASSSLAVDLTQSIAWAHDKIDKPLCDWQRFSYLSLSVSFYVRTVLKYLTPLSKFNKMRVWLVENGPDAYAEKVAFALTAFIAAHTQAQDEMRWMSSSKTDGLNKVQRKVVKESEAAVNKAKAFLQSVYTISIGESEMHEDNLIDYVKARQISALLLTRVSAFIDLLTKHGVLEEWMTEHLLHEIEHDEVSLRKHLKMHIDRTGSDAEIAQGHKKVQELLQLYQTTMDAEGIDVVTKKSWKDMFKVDKEALKKKKHLPGKKSVIEVTSASSSSATIASAQAAPQAAAAPPTRTSNGPVLPPGWTAATDPNSGRAYYTNSSTGATSWEVPTV